MNQFDIAYNKDLTNDFDYRLLSRLQSDCKYYLGQGNKCEKYLYAQNAVDQIKKMKELYDKLPVKPEWCTYDDILEYEKLMCTQANDTITEDLFSSEDLALIVEHCQLINESAGKWAKNTFLKFGKKSVQAELQKTIKEFINMYKFSRFDPDKPKTFGKIEGGYLITVKFDITDWKHAEIKLSVISPKSKRPVQDFQNVLIKIRHSYTEEEIADKINDELSAIDLEITTNPGKVPSDFFEKNNNKQQSQGDIQQKTDEAFDKVAMASGFETETFKEKLSEVEGDKPHKISLVKSLISGWKKLDENERKIFQQLQ